MPAIEYFDKGVIIQSGMPVFAPEIEHLSQLEGREKTIAYKIIRAHEASGFQRNNGNNKYNNEEKLKLKFDALISHDITYVGIIQTARASGMTEFPIPYALTNCHNSLCAVGGTINADDHAFGLSAAKRYGGIYVPANIAVIHQYARDVLTGCGKMILGSDSHTRYGCYGTMGIGEGGGELVKQLLNNTYDIEPPEVVLVWLEDSLPRGTGPHDVALALIKETFPYGKVKNKILEFAGPGIASLAMDTRAGIDVMTTETTCLSSIWETDDAVFDFYNDSGRPKDFSQLSVSEDAYYDAIIKINLSKIESMISLPFHPSKAYTIHELQQEPERILSKAQEDCNRELGAGVKLDLMSSINENGEVQFEQGVIVGCAGGMYDSISEAADILNGRSIGNGYFDLSVYPASMPVMLGITQDGIAETLMNAGTLIKPAFCGPCFGAGDTPANNMLSIRHATRNFASREGSKPDKGQISAVALMDAHSIAATAANKGTLTAATDVDYIKTPRKFNYEASIYNNRCYNGVGKPDPSVELRIGPNITDWPNFDGLQDNLLLRLCAVIHDDVTTTDELIPSGETSSYRSNPIALAEFTLSRRVPEYVSQSKAVRELEMNRKSGNLTKELKLVLEEFEAKAENTSIGSSIYANKPGDGSAREQAASCQRVLGGLANISVEYATKRYRSNCINWGIIPFTLSENETFNYKSGDWIYIPKIKQALLSGEETHQCKVLSNNILSEITLKCHGLSKDDRDILINGCLMNYYKNKR